MAFLDTITEASNANEESPTMSSEYALRKAEPLPGLPDLDYPTPFVVRRTFIDTEVIRPASLSDFWGDREIQSCPPGTIGMMHADNDNEEAPPRDALPKPDDERELQEAGSAVRSARSRSTSVGSSASDLSSFVPARAPATLLGQNPAASSELPGHLELASGTEPHFMSTATAAEPEEWQRQEEAATQELGAMGAWWQAGIPCPPSEPPVVNCPSLAEPVAPPVPSHAATRPAVLAAVPVLLLSEAVSQPQPAVGQPELPSAGSAAHASGTCKPCAYFAHVRGCSNGLQCPFCHLCPPGELKRRQKALRLARPRVQQPTWQAATAYRRRREWAERREN